MSDKRDLEEKISRLEDIINVPEEPKTPASKVEPLRTRKANAADKKAMKRNPEKW